MLVTRDDPSPHPIAGGDHGMATCKRTSLPDRFWRRVDRSGPRDDCWIWRGPLSKSGYGFVWVPTTPGKGTTLRAHRVAYELNVGPIPEGLVIDHLCRNTRCVNPLHLRACTHHENVVEAPGSLAPAALNAKLTHCRRGHEFTPENTEVWNRRRVCLKCKRMRDREGQRRRKAKWLETHTPNPIYRNSGLRAAAKRWGKRHD